ncbi:RNA polymerase sigma factor [Paraflavitalea pollutisoli]|uniref:RNA polymerase sigma factor n=1 Tax=Paraflavitalea pollutisoli TaxID=3034143 RepID=UPI0023ED926C|nr:sigma-70 family RNA polymerase sigma factor [Paraflavitalea sp. H1-2-19X]
MQKQDNDIRQLFQQEFTRTVAVISKQFGLTYIETAEDLVSETFLQAAETWGMKGLPPNPVAWLYAVAKQKTLYHFRRDKILQQKVLPAVKQAQEMQADPEEPDFSTKNIQDSQLQMVFAVCHPIIPAEAQIGLALRILCGFGIDEIADAFLTNKETINKRLFRAKEKLREGNIDMEMPAHNEILKRLDSVWKVVYLLFNEGYYSRSQNDVLRKDLCLEALRLGKLLADHEATSLPTTHALMALMCYHASRLEARTDSAGELILYDQQDEALWNRELIAQGDQYLHLSGAGNELSSFHLEAGIAFWHSRKEDSPEKWQRILQLYDLLSRTNASPAVALNRVYAIYRVQGAPSALSALEALTVPHDQYYHLLAGELYSTTDRQQARFHYEQAVLQTRVEAERVMLRKKIGQLNA